MITENYINKENLKEKTNLWFDNFYKKKDNFLFDINKSALLVIDVQDYFTSSESKTYLPSSKAIIPQIKKLINHWEQNKSLIIFTKHSHKSQSDLGLFAKFYRSYIKSSDTLSNLSFDTKSNNIIQKNTYDAFHDTDLDKILKKQNIEQLVITGCMTHLCCETTARSAFIHNYEVYLPIDALFTKTEALHQASLNTLSDGFVIIKTTDKIIKN